MNEPSWKGHVAATSGVDGGLDTRALDEVIGCIEDIIAAEGVVDSAAVQVLIGVGACGLGACQSAMTARVRALPRGGA
jgi:hypothetical protein